jgi:hypothetical protein
MAMQLLRARGRAPLDGHDEILLMLLGPSALRGGMTRDNPETKTARGGMSLPPAGSVR